MVAHLLGSQFTYFLSRLIERVNRTDIRDISALLPGVMSAWRITSRDFTAVNRVLVWSNDMPGGLPSLHQRHRLVCDSIYRT